eukprot:CAMPEP_0196131462 /NCGR_PEP_ID=MMETSP0910-20130528/1462_1 /TAXON_ID=49265 /ORGANISM="Thalassiosira rotula, Strain GSO102" /LENGTH=616 /DNA_ID=CAMNT_0041390933 /DNA_START=126 /DNA_END=1977 /DNA_ORIENTATION=-
MAISRDIVALQYLGAAFARPLSTASSPSREIHHDVPIRSLSWRTRVNSSIIATTSHSTLFPRYYSSPPISLEAKVMGRDSQHQQPQEKQGKIIQGGRRNKDFDSPSSQLPAPVSSRTRRQRPLQQQQQQHQGKQSGKIIQGGKWNKDYGHAYAQIGGPIDESTCDLSVIQIHKLIRDRIQCRREHEFQKADDIREELRRCGVLVNDAAKAWRADGIFWFPSMVHVPKMSECSTIDEAIQNIYVNIENANPRDIAAFWTVVPKLLYHHQRSGRQQFLPQLEFVFDKTLRGIEKYGRRDLTQTALSIAKIWKSTGRGARGSYHQFLRDTIKEKRFDIFQTIADAAIPNLDEFEPRYLSNLAYAYALVECMPRVRDGTTIFGHLARKSIPSLDKFNAQDLSNIVWAFAKAGTSHSLLFVEVASRILIDDDDDDNNNNNDNGLPSFKPQEISNTMWAYAKAEESHPRLFDAVARHIVSHDDLHAFDPQCISNTVWAFAKAKLPHYPLFRKVANHIDSLENLVAFEPQHLSNIVWAYARVKISQPYLFGKIADHIVSLPNLEDFTEQDMQNIGRAFQKARVSHRSLYAKLIEAGCVIHTTERKRVSSPLQDDASLKEWWRE